MLTPESRKEFFGRLIGFRNKPRHHARPRCLEGILARAPVSRRLGSCAMRGADLAVSPGMCQTLQKKIEIGIAVREHVDPFAGGEPGEVVLDRSDFIEEPQRVERPEHGPQAVFHRLGDGRRGKQPRTRRLGWVVTLNEGWKKLTNNRDAE